MGWGEGRRTKAFGSFLLGVFVMFSASVVYPEEFELLRPEEFASLQHLVATPGQCIMPPAHISRLLALGLISMQPGIPCITSLGRSRLAVGI